MLDVVNYFIGAFHRLFFYCDNNWTDTQSYVLCFYIVVSVMCAITLVGLFSVVRTVVSALANTIRKE